MSQKCTKVAHSGTAGVSLSGILYVDTGSALHFFGSEVVTWENAKKLREGCMKRNGTNALAAVAVAIGLWMGQASCVVAALTTLDLSYKIDPEGVRPPASGPVWLSASFEETVANKEVTVTLTWGNVPDGTQLKWFGLNYTGDASKLTLASLTSGADFDLTTSSGVPPSSGAIPTAHTDEGLKADGDGYYDIVLGPDKGGWIVEKEAKESMALVFTITSKDQSIAVEDFTTLVSHPGGGNGTWLVAAHLGGYTVDGKDASMWISEGPGGGPVVPEPSTIIAGALLLLPFGASARRILRRKS